jgi:hypothetical protein
MPPSRRFLEIAGGGCAAAHRALESEFNVADRRRAAIDLVRELLVAG